MEHDLLSMQQRDVSIAIVVPWIHGIRGHRISINLASELARRGARVDYFVGRIHEPLVATVRAGLGDATLHVGATLPTGKTSMVRYARYQYSRLLDRELARTIAAEHARARYDVVFVVSNEGHWMAGYLRRYLPEPRPILAVNVREMVEHPFLLGYERPFKRARMFFSPLYPLAHQIETERLREFDLVFSNSPWTAGLLDYFYGIRRSPSLIVVDSAFYDIPLATGASAYVAVPTAALDRPMTRLLLELKDRLPNLRTYGKLAVPGIPHAGFLPDAELPPFLAAARATLFLFDYEALGLMPLESLAAGTPVVTIPKEGPYVVLRDNPYVRFGTTVDELVTGVNAVGARASDRAWRAGCRTSMAAFHPRAATDRWLRTVSEGSALRAKLGALGAPTVVEDRGSSSSPRTADSTARPAAPRPE
jgi:glycosyltransferase involved in cell wall biosynthesis